MRIKITARSRRELFFPFNHQHALVANIYGMFKSASPEYADFLHNIGFRHTDSGDPADTPYKTYKLFTFSRLKLNYKGVDKYGFRGVTQMEFVFSTPLDNSYESLILGLFEKRQFEFRLGRDPMVFYVENVESLPERFFDFQESFICKSPIVVSTMIDREEGKRSVRYLNYLIQKEREHFIENLWQNLVRKYEVLYQEPYLGEYPFSFRFDPEYIARHNGKIGKWIVVKQGIKVLGMEAPFSIEADPVLIKVGYDCGFGEKNGTGFGCVE